MSAAQVARSQTKRRRTASRRRPSANLPSEARRLLVGGVNSPVRAFRQIGGEPLFLTRAQGATVFDVEGRAYLDFIMGWGAIILGHQHTAVRRALARTAREGILTGLTHPDEVELARLIVDAVPGIEQVRFTTSGTEACLTAVRLARGITKRAKILTFEGCYHGHGESLMAHKSLGTPLVLEQHTLAVPFNDLGAFEQAIAHHGEELACVMLEPVAANMGVVAPAPGYLSRIRQLTRQHGILLIFDEVVTGFRVSAGGAQRLFGISPDLTTFGKIIGGGLPVGAVGGPERLMQHLAPAGEVFHGGTFAGHPLAMATGIATLTELRAHPPYERLDHLGAELTAELGRVAGKAGVPVQINRVGSMFTVFFSDRPIRNAAEAKGARGDHFARWATSLRRQGVLVPPAPFEALFLSCGHTAQDMKRCVQASRQAFDHISKIKNQTSK